MTENVKYITGNVIRIAKIIYDAQIKEGFTEKEAFVKVHYFLEGAREALVNDENTCIDSYKEFNRITKRLEDKLEHNW